MKISKWRQWLEYWPHCLEVCREPTRSEKARKCQLRSNIKKKMRQTSPIPSPNPQTNRQQQPCQNTLRGRREKPDEWVRHILLLKGIAIRYFILWFRRIWDLCIFTSLKYWILQNANRHLVEKRWVRSFIILCCASSAVAVHYLYSVSLPAAFPLFFFLLEFSIGDTPLLASNDVVSFPDV